MPLIEVKLFDYRVTPEVSAALIEKLTGVRFATCRPSGGCATTRG